MRSNAVGLDYQYVFKILKKYNGLGEEGVRSLKKKSVEHPRGKEPLLNEKQFQELTAQLKKRPPDGGIWTGPKVAQWLEKETGIERVWNQRGWDFEKQFNAKLIDDKPRKITRKSRLCLSEVMTLIVYFHI